MKQINDLQLFVLGLIEINIRKKKYASYNIRLSLAFD